MIGLSASVMLVSSTSPGCHHKAEFHRPLRHRLGPVTSSASTPRSSHPIHPSLTGDPRTSDFSSGKWGVVLVSIVTGCCSPIISPSPWRYPLLLPASSLMVNPSAPCTGHVGTSRQDPQCRRQYTWPLSKVSIAVQGPHKNMIGLSGQRDVGSVFHVPRVRHHKSGISPVPLASARVRSLHPHLPKSGSSPPHYHPSSTVIPGPETPQVMGVRPYHCRLCRS